MAGPWEKYAAQPQGGQPGMIPLAPKAPANYRNDGPGRVAPLTGGPADPAQAARIAAAEAGARARAATPVEVAGQIAAARAKAQIEASAAAAKSDREALRLDPQKLANIRAAQGQIDRLQYLYNKGPGRTKGLAGFADLLPSPENAQFDTAGAGLGEVGLAAFRTPGVGSQSDAELRAFIDANRPSARDFDARITEKLGNLQNRLNQTYQAYGMKRPPAPKYKGEPRTISFHDLPE